MVAFLKTLMLVSLYLSMPLATYYVAPAVAEALDVSETGVIVVLIVGYFGIPYAWIIFYPTLERGARRRQNDGARHRRILLEDDAQIQADPYAVLGLDSQASNEDIKRAFRDMLKRYHPDLVEHMDPVAKSVALEMTKKATLAFSVIRKERDV